MWFSIDTHPLPLHIFFTLVTHYFTYFFHPCCGRFSIKNKKKTSIHILNCLFNTGLQGSCGPGTLWTNVHTLIHPFTYYRQFSDFNHLQYMTMDWGETRVLDGTCKLCTHSGGRNYTPKSGGLTNMITTKPPCPIRVLFFRVANTQLLTIYTIKHSI